MKLWNRPLAVAACLGLSVVSGHAALAATPVGLWSQLGSRATRRALEQAARSALTSLESAECRQVFSDFTDARGHTLLENLDAIGETPVSYLHMILFADGDDQGRCKDRGTMARTTPGSRVVFIYARQFERVVRQNPRHAEAIVIHEALHTLGLAEDPPSSAEITNRVLARCR